jgi:hypothetical protein
MKSKTIFSIIAFTMGITVTFYSCKHPQEEEPAPVTPAAPASCIPASSYSPPAGPNLVFQFKFDTAQVRLDNFGNPVAVGAGNSAQTPTSFRISQHYIELACDFDSLGHGQVLYLGPTTTAGGGTAAINYCASTITGNNQVFFAKPLSQIAPGSYNWLRVSLAFQTYNIIYKSQYLSTPNHTSTGTVASFIGYKTYISGYQINGHDYVPSTAAGGPGNHVQGYWGFETSVMGSNYFYDGQAPANATTVPNPNFANSPIPAGSCVVTGKFVNSTGSSITPLVVTGLETQDIIITVSLSINKSFEWHEAGTVDGCYQPEIGDVVVDMGVRGSIPYIN